MRYKGKKLNSPNVEMIFIPRADGDIVLAAQAVLSFEPFDKLCPVPRPPTIKYAGAKEAVPDEKDAEYLAEMDKYSKKRYNWLIYTSLRASEDLEWELVKPDEPETWLKVVDELNGAGFSSAEVTRILNGVFAANSLDESRVEEARQNFLRTQAAQAKS